MEWKEINPNKHSWLVWLKEEYPEDVVDKRFDRTIKKYFVPKGKRLWPLLSLTVCPDMSSENPLLSTSIHCSIKAGRDEWWGKSGIPNSLLDSMSELIKEYQKSVEGLTTDFKWLMSERRFNNLETGRMWMADDSHLRSETLKLRKAALERGDKLSHN